MAAINNKVDLQSLLNLKAWTPLAELNHDFLDLCDGLIKLNEEVYVQTQRYNRFFQMDDVRAPFVTKIYWASTIEVVNRCILCERFEVNLSNHREIPIELLSGTSGKYSDLVKLSDKNGIGNERAVYSKNGEFLYKIIGLGRFNYYFLNNIKDDGEIASMIGIDLIK